MSSVVEVVGVRPISRSDKASLGREILTTYARVRWLLHRHALPVVLETLRADAGPAPRGDAARLASLTAVRLGHAVIRTLKPLPTDSRCLVRSLVLTAILSRRGIDSSLVIGVRPGESLEAHAWLEREQIPLLPAGTDYDRLLEA